VAASGSSQIVPLRAPLVSEALRSDVLTTGRALVERGLVVGSVGNVSARVRQGLIITPTRARYETMTQHDLVLAAHDGTVIAGTGTPSRELPLHLGVYAARPDARALVHTHSVHATAWSYLGASLEPALEDADYYAIGPVRTSAPARAGSAALAVAAVRALGDSRAVLLGRHGVLALGSTLDEALTVALVVERQAHVAWLLRSAPAS
jgi:L-ribulose-5-phosphate 4-epimerase